MKRRQFFFGLFLFLSLFVGQSFAMEPSAKGLCRRGAGQALSVDLIGLIIEFAPESRHIDSLLELASCAPAIYAAVFRCHCEVDAFYDKVDHWKCYMGKKFEPGEAIVPIEEREGEESFDEHWAKRPEGLILNLWHRFPSVEGGFAKLLIAAGEFFSTANKPIIPKWKLFFKVFSTEYESKLSDAVLADVTATFGDLIVGMDVSAEQLTNRGHGVLATVVPQDLQKLFLFDCGSIDDDSLSPLSNLSSLSLGSVEYDDTSLVCGSCFPNMPNLTSLLIVGCNLVNDHLLSLRRLESLRLHECRGEGLGVGFEKLENLRVLKVANVDKFCFSSLGLMPCLNRLHVDYSPGLTAGHLKPIKRLRWLGMSDCSLVDPSCLRELPCLEVLELDNMDVGDEHLEGMDKIGRMRIYSSSELAGRCFESMGGLWKVMITSCPKLDERYLETLKARGVEVTRGPEG